MLHVLIIFNIYQSIHSFPNNRKPPPTKFRKHFWYNSEYYKVSFTRDGRQIGRSILGENRRRPSTNNHSKQTV